MRISIILLLLLPWCAVAQNGIMTDYISEEIEFAGETDSVALSATIPAGCAVTKCITYVDTVITNASNFTVKLRESGATLINYNVTPEADIIGAVHVDRPDVATGQSEETPVLHWTLTGADPVTGRLRVVVFFERLY